MAKILVEYKGWALNEKLEYVHLEDNGIVRYSVDCHRCLTVLPDEHWDYLRKVKMLLVPQEINKGIPFINKIYP